MFAVLLVFSITVLFACGPVSKCYTVVLVVVLKLSWQLWCCSPSHSSNLPSCHWTRPTVFDIKRGTLEGQNQSWSGDDRRRVGSWFRYSLYMWILSGS